MAQTVTHIIIALLDLLASLALVWANQQITAEAGLTSRKGLWALARRITYLTVAGALFMKFIYRIDTYDTPLVLWDVLPQIPILIGIVLFPILRAFGVITQDAFVNGDETTQKPRTPKQIARSNPWL